MRIISGTHKGRPIYTPKNLPVRPTTDFAKESLFNIFNNNFDFEEIKVLDLFTGTGGMSYEFASRGSKDITAVDSNYKCFAFVKETVSKFDFNIRVIKSDVFAFLKNHKNTYDIIFADPPYESEKIEVIPQLVFANNMLKKGGWLIVEHSVRTDLSKEEHFLEKRTYGNANFSIFGIKSIEF